MPHDHPPDQRGSSGAGASRRERGASIWTSYKLNGAQKRFHTSGEQIFRRLSVHFSDAYNTTFAQQQYLTSTLPKALSIAHGRARGRIK
jgi:hypothetical protein